MRPMRARQAVLLTPSKSSGPTQLLSCKHLTSITHLESTLIQVFILNNLNLFGINTYEKHGGRGHLLHAWLGTPKNTSRIYLSSQALARCSSRISFLLITIQFHGGWWGVLPCHALLTSAPSGDGLAEV